MVKSRKKRFIVLIVALLVILAGVFVFILFTFNAVTKDESSASTASVSSSQSSSKKQPVTEEAYLTAMGDRLTSQPLPVIGQIAIPDLKINLPIFEGAGDKQILYGAGTVSDNTVIGTGNVSLAAHHVFYIAGADSYLFSPLTGSQNGMMIYLTDKTYIYKYRIDKLFVVPDTDVSVLEPVAGKSVVTLIYCVNFTGPDRAIVRGTLESKQPFAESGSTVQSYFTAPFNQVAADQVGGLE
ncbi:class A sortase [Lactovum odontotermitis]